MSACRCSWAEHPLCQRRPARPIVRPGGSTMNRAVTAAAARITAFEVTGQESFSGGQDFGAGPYLRISGIARGELDPADPRNAPIADLGLAPRNARGQVEYAAEVVILRPADPARANGRLLYDVTNRGRKMMFGGVFDAPGGQPELNALRTPGSVGLALP